MLSTTLIGLALAAIVAAVIAKMYKDKKQGKTSCGCGCENCPSAGLCHGTEKAAHNISIK